MIKKILIFLSVLSFTYSESYSFNDSFNQFGVSLFKKINSNGDSNFMISPFSIAYALMMVNYGASGETADEILATLNLDKVDSFNPYDGINSKFQINNSIWIQNDNCYNPNMEYINYIDSLFYAKASYVNFYTDRLSIIQDINEWVKEKTFGTIKDIVSENDIKKNTTQALLNTIYFKDSWQFPFDTLKSDIKIFHSPINSSKMMFMNKKNKFAHYKNTDFHLLELPYQSDGISMFIFLPSKEIDINAFIDNLDYQLISNSIDSLDYDLGNISIPKFSLDYSVSLKDYLMSMGMSTAFNPKDANFDKFWDFQQQCKKYPPKHYIDVVNHKTYINIDENGTEASAATAVIISRVTSIRPDKHFVFNANRPFVYVVYDKINKAMMFLGQHSG